MIAHILNPQNSLPFDVNYNHEHMYHLSLLVYYIALLLVTWYYCAMSCVHCTIIAVLSRELIFLFHWPPANHPRNHMPRCLESWFFLHSKMFTTKYDPRDRKTNVSLPWPTKKKKKKDNHYFRSMHYLYALGPERKRTCGQLYTHRRSRRTLRGSWAGVALVWAPKCSSLNPSQNIKEL